MTDHSPDWAAVPLVLTPDEAATLLRLDTERVIAMCRAGALRARDLDGEWRINRHDLMAALGIDGGADAAGCPESQPARGEAIRVAAQVDEERRFLAAILDAVPMPVTYLDDRLVYRHCNAAAAHEFGIPAADVLGRHLHEVVPGNPQLWRAVEHVLHTGEPHTQTVITVHWEHRPDEGPRHHAVYYLPDRDGAGRIRGIMAAGQDITESMTVRQRLEQQVRERTAELEAHRGQLRALTHRLLDLQEVERRRLARELHDEAAQIVTGLSLGLAALARHPETPPAVAGRLEASSRIVAELMRELHRIVSTLRPAILDAAGLEPALRQYVATFNERHGLPVELATAGFDDRRLPYEVDTALFRLIQEALTNVARHAEAGRAEVTLEWRAGVVTASVADDGVGFDPEEATRSGRLGLVGMRERAAMIGGELTIDSAPGRGARIEVSVPVPASHPHTTTAS